MNDITNVMLLWLQRIPKAKAVAARGAAELRQFAAARIYDPVTRVKDGEDVKPWAGITGALLLKGMDSVQWDLLASDLTSEPINKAA